MKKAYTIEQQIARLKSNGMTFDNEEKAKEILLDVGYYRLGFYSFPYEINFPCLEHRDHKLMPLTVSRSISVQNLSIIYRSGILMTPVGLSTASM